MGFSRNYDSFEDIARIMSEQTKTKVTVDDVRMDVSTVTTAIYSAVIQDNTAIICTVRNWGKQPKYEVTMDRV